jgi:SAM-dependent methyltransferase
MATEQDRAAPGVSGSRHESHDSLVARIQRVVRFALPYHAKVVVISEGNSALLDLEGRQTWHFPATRNGVYAGPFPVNGARAVEQLEALRAEGAEYLLIPRTAFWWLDHYDALRQYLSDHCRTVLREEDACLVIALHDHFEPELREEGAPDGLPLPPPEMLALVTGNYSIPNYLEGTRRVSGLITRTLEANGIEIGSLREILDFGCGSGRVIRRWKDLSGVRLFGVDYNPYLVEWCRTTLPFASFQSNSSMQPLDFADESLDFIYSFSVFTHLDLESQAFWMNELIRVLRPGGFLFFTVHGTAYVGDLSAEDQERFRHGEVILHAEAFSGSSACYVLHPKAYVENVLAPQLDLIDFVPGGPGEADSFEVMQDALLLRRPSA